MTRLVVLVVPGVVEVLARVDDVDSGSATFAPVLRRNAALPFPMIGWIGLLESCWGWLCGAILPPHEEDASAEREEARERVTGTESIVKKGWLLICDSS